MSRAGAAVGSLVGAGAGVAITGFVGAPDVGDRAIGVGLMATLGGAIGAAVGAGSSARSPGDLSGPPLTPAQASGHPNFITDVPVQGPTDEGLREASCWWKENRIPTQEYCVDCPGGPVPMWTRQTLTPANRGPNSGIGERISFGGRGALGFALEAAGDPEVWTTLTPQQQEWIVAALTTLNAKIIATTGTTCPTWGPSITAAGGCFQHWFNLNTKGTYTSPSGKPLVLRTDGTFDQDTLDALITIAGMSDPQGYAKNPFPSTAVEKKKLSKGAIYGMVAGGVVVVGGVAYLIMRK